MKQKRKVTRTSATAENCKTTGIFAEKLAADALRNAGYSNVENLNDEIRHFPFADLLAEKDGIWYAVSVKGRHRLQRNGKVNTGYKLQRSDAELAIKKIGKKKGVECEPAFAAVEFDGDRYSVYFDLIDKSLRKNRIGMKDSERAAYQCLVCNQLHHLPIRPNEYSTQS
ncbi:MAG: hypothetical protein ABSB35_26430 [Bryobacteraceae bacterium]|jgi:Holliday junction resolvase-like predicted endonuclease